MLWVEKFGVSGFSVYQAVSRKRGSGSKYRGFSKFGATDTPNNIYTYIYIYIYGIMMRG